MKPHGEHCPSDLSLDRWLAGELTAAEAQAQASHVESCAACQGRRAALAEARRRFPREAPPFASLVAAARQPPRSGPVRRSRQGARVAWLAGGCGLAAAAVIALAIGAAWRAAPSDGAGGFAASRSGTRTKGGPASLGWVVRRGGRVFAGRPEQPLRPGDAVRFTISARQPVFVAVIGLNASAEPSVYYPDAAELARLDAGNDQLLPAAIELDVTPGDERLYGVFCERALPVASAVEAIERAPDAPALPAGCSAERHVLHREAP